MNIYIKTATVEDAELIADISRQTFYDTFAAQNTAEDMQKFLDEQFTRAALIEEVGAAGNTFLIAYVNNDVAGYARLRQGNGKGGSNDDTAIEIARLYAQQSMIGQGVGSALMQACINEAKAKNKKMIWLGVWEKNSRAIEFYTKWGFTKFGEHDFVLGNDVQRDWLMKKQIT